MSFKKKNLKKARLMRDLSVEEVAEKGGWSNRYIYDLEAGRRRLNEEHLILFSKLYGVSSDYLLELSNLMIPDEELYKEVSKLKYLSDDNLEYIIRMVEFMKEKDKEGN